MKSPICLFLAAQFIISTVSTTAYGIEIRTIPKPAFNNVTNAKNVRLIENGDKAVITYVTGPANQDLIQTYLRLQNQTILESSTYQGAQLMAPSSTGPSMSIVERPAGPVQGRLFHKIVSAQGAHRYALSSHRYRLENNQPIFNGDQIDLVMNSPSGLSQIDGLSWVHQNNVYCDVSGLPPYVLQNVSGDWRPFCSNENFHMEGVGFSQDGGKLLVNQIYSFIYQVLVGGFFPILRPYSAKATRVLDLSSGSVDTLDRELPNYPNPSIPNGDAFIDSANEGADISGHAISPNGRLIAGAREFTQAATGDSSPKIVLEIFVFDRLTRAFRWIDPRVLQTDYNFDDLAQLELAEIKIASVDNSGRLVVNYRNPIPGQSATTRAYRVAMIEPNLAIKNLRALGAYESCEAKGMVRGFVYGSCGLGQAGVPVTLQSRGSLWRIPGNTQPQEIFAINAGEFIANLGNVPAMAEYLSSSIITVDDMRVNSSTRTIQFGVLDNSWSAGLITLP